jgi:hypothetical protein
VSGQPQLALPIGVEDDGEVRMYRIALPFLPPSKNVYANWPREWKSSAKNKWVRAIAAEVESQAMPKGVAKIGLAAVLVFPTNARRDTQNYAEALWHWVPDALVRAGVVTDDRAGQIEIGPNWGVTFRVDSRKNLSKQHRSRTHLVVTMLSPR